MKKKLNNKTESALFLRSGSSKLNQTAFKTDNYTILNSNEEKKIFILKTQFVMAVLNPDDS